MLLSCKIEINYHSAVALAELLKSQREMLVIKHPGKDVELLKAGCLRYSYSPFSFNLVIGRRRNAHCQRERWSSAVDKRGHPFSPGLPCSDSGDSLGPAQDRFSHRIWPGARQLWGFIGSSSQGTHPLPGSAAGTLVMPFTASSSLP